MSPSPFSSCIPSTLAHATSHWWQALSEYGKSIQRCHCFPSGAPRTYLTECILALVPKNCWDVYQKNPKKRWKVWRRIVESCNGTSRISWQWTRKPWRCILTASWWVMVRLPAQCDSHRSATPCKMWTVSGAHLPALVWHQLQVEHRNHEQVVQHSHPICYIAIVDLPLNIIIAGLNTLLYTKCVCGNLNHKSR